MLSKDPVVDGQVLNEEMSQLRNVRTSLWKQPNLKQFHRFLLEKGSVFDDEDGDAPSYNAHIDDETEEFFGGEDGR